MAIKRNILPLAAILVVIGAAPFKLQAQGSPFDTLLSAEAALILESVDACTDRSLYISGEPVRFRARVETSGLPDEREWSRILYVELFSASGVRRTGGKFRIRDGAASGDLRIPEDLLSGTYYLRSYTRWMRNRHPSGYSYLPIRIVNPHTEEVTENAPEEQGAMVLEPLSVAGDALDLSAGSSYGRGDTVILELLLKRDGSTAMVKGCLSVVPLAVRPGEAVQAAAGTESGDFRLSYLPDLFGVTLSGMALNDTRVHLTPLEGQGSYLVAPADDHGRFAVTLPWIEGKLPLLVQPEYPGSEPGEVRIDQDYDSRILPLEIPGFRLSMEERQTLTIMARNVQLSGIFAAAGKTGDGKEKAAAPLFYGTPAFSLDMDDYVLLPTLEEILINLVPVVTPVTRRNKRELIIASENQAISLFPPLLLIDQVPVFDLERFLSVPPGKIAHIDVVTDVYLKGDNRYGGIINLRTREGNMAGIDLPEQAFFIDFEVLYPQPEEPGGFSFPGDRLPDTRNTFLWMPELSVDGYDPLSVTFIAPDFPGEYVIIFRGWDEKGKRISAESRFLVE